MDLPERHAGNTFRFLRRHGRHHAIRLTDVFVHPCQRCILGRYQAILLLPAKHLLGQGRLLQHRGQSILVERRIGRPDLRAFREPFHRCLGAGALLVADDMGNAIWRVSAR